MSVIVCASCGYFYWVCSYFEFDESHWGKNSMNMNSAIWKYLHDLDLFIVWWFFSIMLRANLKFYKFCFPIWPKKMLAIYIWVHCIRIEVSFRNTPACQAASIPFTHATANKLWLHAFQNGTNLVCCCSFQLSPIATMNWAVKCNSKHMRSMQNTNEATQMIYNVYVDYG